VLKLKSTVCVEASKEATWKVLSDIENISDWVDVVITAKSTGIVSKGVDAERTCELKHKVTIIERWIAWDEGNSFTYEGFNVPMVKSAKNTWTVKAENGKTIITTESVLVLKGGIIGRMFEPLVKLMSKRLGTKSLASLKYLVENGKPFAGK
jgi:hypothetical protein